MINVLKHTVGALVEHARRTRSVLRARHTEPHYSRQQLAIGLAGLGIRKGDAVFIHSSLKSLGYVSGGPESVIGAFQDAVGLEGTLLLPTYYLPGGSIHGTCELQDYKFDVMRHGTNLGRLPEEFLKLKDIHRSVHPTHSVSAWGKHARYLTENHHLAPSVFGKDSPWQRLLELENAKVLGLGVSMGPITFYHLLEDSLGEHFPVRVWQDRTYYIPSIDRQQNEWQVPVRPYDPAVAARRIDHPSRSDLRNYFREEFLRVGLLKVGQVGNAESWILNAQGFFDHLKYLAEEGITIYSSTTELIASSKLTK